MTRAPEPRDRPDPPRAAAGPRALRRRLLCPRPVDPPTPALVADLRRVLAAAAVTDPFPLDHLGAGPVRSSADVASRVDGLARELVVRMDAEGWDAVAVPRVVTSVLAASVPAAETVLRRAAGRAGRAREVR